MNRRFDCFAALLAAAGLAGILCAAVRRFFPPDSTFGPPNLDWTVAAEVPVQVAILVWAGALALCGTNRLLWALGCGMAPAAFIGLLSQSLAPWPTAIALCAVLVVGAWPNDPTASPAPIAPAAIGTVALILGYVWLR